MAVVSHASDSSTYRGQFGDSIPSAANVSSGDLIIVHATYELAGAGPTLSGFNRDVWFASNNPASYETIVFWKIAQSADETDSTNSGNVSYQINDMFAGGAMTAAVSRWTGVDDIDPIGVSQVDAAGSDGLSVPGFDVDGGDVVFLGWNQVFGSNGFAANPAGFSTLYTEIINAVTPNVRGSYRSYSTGGSTGTISSGTDQWQSFFAIQINAGGTAPPPEPTSNTKVKIGGVFTDIQSQIKVNGTFQNINGI